MKLWNKIRWGRLVWTLFVTLYFITFFKTMLNDALPGRSLTAALFAFILVLWLAVEYYFGSPFFQSGAVEPSQLWRSLFALFYYPFLGYCAADYIWFRKAQMGPLAGYASVLGIIVFMVGVLLRVETLRIALGSPANKVVRRGPFRSCRQPRYLATLIQLFGIPLVFSSWSGLLLAAGIGLPLILAEIHDEEKRLLALYPDDYRAYQQAVPLLLPRARRPA